MIDDQMLLGVLSNENDVQVAADRLVDSANQAGGEDNITVVLINVVDGADGAPSRPPVTRSSTPTQDSDAERGHGWGRKLAWGLAVIVLIASGLLAARWFVLSHAWFVGTNAAGVITIYKGIPDEFAGVTLKQTKQQTGLKVSSLPRFLRPNVNEGIKVDSYDAALTTITNLKQRAKEFTEPAPTPSPSPSRHKKKR